MKTRRSAAVRLAASAMLAAAVTLGAHAFVPTAFGCGQMSGSTCKEAQTEPNNLFSYSGQFQLLIDVVTAVLP